MSVKLKSGGNMNEENVQKPSWGGSLSAEGEVNIGASYSIYNEIKSENASVSVSPQEPIAATSYTIGVTINASVAPPYTPREDLFLRFIPPKVSEEAEEGGRVGLHMLTWECTRTGFLQAGNRELSLAGFSEMGILTGSPSGISWISPPGGESVNVVLGWREGGGWGWFSVKEQPDPCEEIS